MAAYRAPASREPPRVLVLRPGRGRSAVIMMAFWTGLTGLVLASLVSSIHAHGVGLGLSRFAAGFVELASVRPSVSILFVVYAAAWCALFFAGVQAWRLRLDVEHHEDDDRLVLTWTRKPFATRRVELRLDDVVDVRIVVDNPQKASSTTHVSLVTKTNEIAVSPSTGDDHRKNVARLRAFLRLDEGPRRAVRAAEDARAEEKEVDGATEGVVNSKRSGR